MLLVIVTAISAGCGGDDTTAAGDLGTTPGAANTAGDQIGVAPTDPTATTTDPTASTTTLPSGEGGGEVYGAEFGGIAGAFEAQAEVAENTMGTDGTTTTATTTTTTKPVTKTTYDYATVEYNGSSRFQLNKGEYFPQDNQLFKVTGLYASSITIELLAGEFSDGSTGRTLTVGNTVTFLNESQGNEYKIRLVSVHALVTTISSPPPPPADPSGVVVPT